MKFTIIITTHPYTRQGSLTAYHFCQAALVAGHTIQTLFFNRDGAYHANVLNVIPQDEFNLCEQWVTLAKRYSFALQVCSTAALHRGIVTAEQAKFYEKPGHNWHPDFIASGLGQLFEAIAQSDRVVEF